MLIWEQKSLNYYQVSCSTYSCDKNQFYVYDLDTNKVLYKISDSKLKIQNYYQYGSDYKVVKYSYSSHMQNIFLALFTEEFILSNL